MAATLLGMTVLAMSDLHWTEVLKRLLVVICVAPQLADCRIFDGLPIDMGVSTLQTIGCLFDQSKMSRVIKVQLNNLLVAMTGGFQEIYLGTGNIWSRIIYSFEGHKMSLVGTTRDGVIQNSPQGIVLGKLVCKIYSCKGLLSDAALMKFASEITPQPALQDGSIFTILRPVAGQKRLVEAARKEAEKSSSQAKKAKTQ